MVLGLYSVYDITAMVYSPPFCAVNDEVAKRVFQQLVASDPTAMIARYPKDFIVKRVGSFDDALGDVSSTLHVPLSLNEGR